MSELDPGNDAEALAIFLGLRLFALLLHAIFRRAGEGGLDAEEGFEDGLGVGDREADAERHEERDVEEGLVPGAREELFLADEVEGGDRHGGGHEEREVDQHHLERALPGADDHGGHEQHGEDDHERVADVGGEVIPGFELWCGTETSERKMLGRIFLPSLDEALGPAGLLGFEGGHLDGELGGALDVLEVFELPAFELRAIAEVGVFGEGVVLPAAGFVDGLATPHAGGAVEVEEDAGAGAAAVLEDEVAVEEDGFDLGEEAVVAIEVRPAGLDHADAGFGEVVDDLRSQSGGGTKSASKMATSSPLEVLRPSSRAPAL